jgi:hypothetical protein
VKEYKVKSTKEKRHIGKNLKEIRHKIPVILFQVESHRMCLISTIMSCDNVSKMFSIRVG